MSQPIIEVRGLSKRYRLGAIGATSLREEFARFSSRVRGGTPSRDNEFWALREVSFEINRGDVVGVIGRNGAGKSTLLKILSRITEPTSGSAVLRGRIASLLEVGTGFHPELTGRENIYLNGAILGMTRREVAQKFDEIVAFSEVDRFIDTPVKRYSSGMYVRLAFAVAAHLEPEILIIDEVLAVGDLAFQRKCLGKMSQVSRAEGRTVVFVSHNLSAVRQLCRRGIVLQSGSLIGSGEIEEVLETYGADQTPSRTSIARQTVNTRACSLRQAKVIGTLTPDRTAFAFGSNVNIELEVVVQRRIASLQVAVRISTADGQAVITTTDSDGRRSTGAIEAGEHRFGVALPGYLAPGHYSVIVALCDPQRNVFDTSEDELGFTIDAAGSLEMELRDGRRGCLELTLPWVHEKLA